MDENNTIVIDIYDTDENIQQTAKIINQYSNIWMLMYVSTKS